MDKDIKKALIASSVIVVVCTVYGGLTVHFPWTSTFGVFIGFGCYFLVRWAQGEF